MANPLGLYVHLTVSGGDKAIAWYSSVFGAQIRARHMAEDQHRVMFAILAMFGGHVFLSDVFPELIADTQAPSAAVPPTCTLHIDLEDPNEVNAVVARAQAAGATVTMMPEDVFWDDRYGRIRDPFGHVWSFGARATQPAQT